MSSAMDDGSAAGSSTKGGTGGSSDSAVSANPPTSYSRMGVTVAVVLCMGGLVILWLMLMGGSKKHTEAPLIPSPPPALVRKPFMPHLPTRRERGFTVPGSELRKPLVPQGANPAPPALIQPPQPAAGEPVSQKPVDMLTTLRPLPAIPASTKGPDVLSEPVYSPEDDYLPPPRSDFVEKLPLYVVPVHYDVMIKVVMDANRDQSFMFGDAYYLGKTIILVRCVKPTQTIYMHATGFTIKEQQTTLVREADKTFIGIARMAVNDDLEMLKIETDTPLEFNETYSLSIEFAGPIKNMPRGIYKAHFTSDNERVTVVATQFTPTYARRVFPCFDEPSLRATFDLVVVRPGHYRSFSNMPLSKSEERSKDFVADYFDRTPLMSTHNLAFVIGPYVTAGNGLIKVHGTTQQVRNADYTLQVAPKILLYCQDTFGLNYPIPKLDFVAAPILPAPAMEQWGLVTFQDIYLTFRADETPFQMKVDSLRVIANKIAQQWMGNLVTMAWWDDIWLKEGISRYITYTAAGRADPQTDVSFMILESDAHYAMEQDGFNFSAPVSRLLNTSTDIRKHINVVTIAKKFVNHLITNQYERLMSEESKDESMQISLPYSYRPIVFCQAIKHGNEDDFNFLWKHYDISANTQERVVLLKALSCTTNLQLLERLLLQLVNKNSGVEMTQKAANLLNAISSTSVSSSKKVIRFMTDHQGAMFNRYGTLQGLFDTILQTIVDNIRHESELEKVSRENGMSSD
ncbi:hypothetical protein V5799_021434 [Amblyomma americanum]|uniref:Aminopeptidase n=1 Tax=Amblyomma americanum TaxID=6943 RepID=A0AAQ4FPV6_AMBAM